MEALSSSPESTLRRRSQRGTSSSHHSGENAQSEPNPQGQTSFPGEGGRNYSLHSNRFHSSLFLCRGTSSRTLDGQPIANTHRSSPTGQVYRCTREGKHTVARGRTRSKR